MSRSQQVEKSSLSIPATNSSSHKAIDNHSYSYTAIPKKHIRLLQFTRIGEGHVIAKIGTFKLGSKECPKYTALSYTWGDKSWWSGHLIMDGKKAPVLASLGPFIDILQTHPGRWKRAWWWIDSICINQENDTEKGVQVEQMSNVYRDADKVVVWLGKEDDMSNEAIDFLSQMHEAQKVAAVEFNKAETAMSEKLKGLGFISQESQSKWTTVSRLFHRPWWTRVWTLQEFVIPRHLTFWCGAKTVPRKVLTGGLYGMWLCHDPHLFGEHGFPVDKQAFDAGWNRRRLRQYIKRITKGQPYKISLIALLAYFSNHKASDPRDRLFSLRGLAADAKKLVPDDKVHYSPAVDTTQVYLDLVKSFVQEHQSLDIICFAEIFRNGSLEDNSQLPTWVPDWRAAVDPTVMPLMVSQSAGVIDNLRSNRERTPTVSYAASGTKRVGVVFGNDSPQSMTCKGIMIDNVDGLGGVPRRAPHVPSTSTTNARGNKKVMHTNEDPTMSQQLVEVICRTLTLDRKDTFLGHAAPMDQFMKDFGALCGAHLNPKSNVEHDFESWVSSNETFTMRGVDIRSVAEHAAKLTPKSREPVDSIHKASFLRRFRDTTATMNRRLMVSTTGHIGMVPISAQTSDLICVLFGCSVPVILRPRAANSFEFVGECYLDGFMNGEALKFPTATKDNATFRIL